MTDLGIENGGILGREPINTYILFPKSEDWHLDFQ